MPFDAFNKDSYKVELEEEAELKARAKAEFDKMVCGEDFYSDLAREAAKDMF